MKVFQNKVRWVGSNTCYEKAWIKIQGVDFRSPLLICGMYIDSTTNQNQSNLKKIIDELNDEVEEYSNNGIIVIGTDLNCDFSRKDDNWRSKLWFEF